MILTAVIHTTATVFVDVIDDRDNLPSEEELESHTSRLQEAHPDWTRVDFYTIPTHPHDPDAYTARTLWEDIQDNQETFSKVLEEQQTTIHQVILGVPLEDDDGDNDDD